MALHVTTGAGWDDRRNTSARVEPQPGAVGTALAACRAGQGKDWYEWIVARGKGEHRHDLRKADGKPAACPVRGCREVS